MKKLLACSLIALPIFSFAEEARGNGLTYNYIGVGYGKIDLDDGELKSSFNGFGVEAGALLNENIFVRANYATASANKLTAGGTSYNLEIDYSQVDAALGYRFAVAAGTDITASVGVAQGRAKVVGQASATDTVYPVGVGLKTLLNEQLELGLNGSVASGDFSASAGLQYKINSNIGVVGSYSHAESTNGYLVSLRYLY